MNNLLQYLFEVALGSSVLFLGFVVLKRALSLKFRRFYLLGCLLIPLALPLTSINSSQPNFVAIPQKIDEVFIARGTSTYQDNSFNNNNEKAESTTEMLEQPSGNSIIWSWSKVLFSLYVLISFLLLGRFFTSLWTILKLKKSAVLRSGSPSFYTLSKKDFTAGSFFSWIFIHEKYVEHPSFEILHAHEHAHVQLWHSMDVLLAEVYCILFWMNPIAWFVKKEVKLNAEFEADRYVHPQFGASNYSNTLINLSVGAQRVGPMVSFSAQNIKTRISRVVSDQKHRWQNALGLIPFIFFSCWLISCEPEMMDFSTMDPQAAMKNVKTVTTRYISHQKDTQQKDGKVIAVAYYLPDGTVDRVEQHMTYPYDYEQPFERKFLANPLPSGVLHILDGFGLGNAENNILYGNDWSRYKEIDDFKNRDRLFTKNISKKMYDMHLPSKYIIESHLNEDIHTQANGKIPKGTISSKFEESFMYEGQKVTSHSRKSINTGSTLFYGGLDSVNSKRMIPEVQLIHETKYKYDGELLIEVTNNSPQNGSLATTKISYKNSIMTSASYFRENKKYNRREFYYNSDGLKTRTEIFNVYGDPEYTIIYDYEYY